MFMKHERLILGGLAAVLVIAVALVYFQKNEWKKDALKCAALFNAYVGTGVEPKAVATDFKELKLDSKNMLEFKGTLL